MPDCFAARYCPLSERREAYRVSALLPVSKVSRISPVSVSSMVRPDRGIMSYPACSRFVPVKESLLMNNSFR